MLLATPVVARARGQAEDLAPAPQGQAAAQSPPVQKPPPPPLFPRHRRGLYRNGAGFWVLDATPQAPPLDVDDPGVPEKGAYEINMTTRTELAPDARSFDLFALDLNYGLAPSIFGHEVPTQLACVVPLSASQVNGQAFSAAAGEVELGVKLNVYDDDSRGLELSVYPQVAFNVSSRAVRTGVAPPGQTLTVPVLVAKEYKYVTTVFNAAISKPLNDPDRRATAALGIGGGLPVTRKFAVMASLRGEAPLDLSEDRTLSVTVGVTRALGHSVVLYTHVGRTLFVADVSKHTSVGFGMKILSGTEPKPQR
jgi:hypothetical protein